MENFIMNYFSDSLKNIKSNTQEIEGEVYNWWGIEDTPVFVLRDDDGELGIAFGEQYVSALCGLFSISEYEAKTYLLRWINSELDIHPDHTIQQEMF